VSGRRWWLFASVDAEGSQEVEIRVVPRGAGRGERIFEPIRGRRGRQRAGDSQSMAQHSESSAFRSGPEVVVYYRGSDIVVTSRYIDTDHGYFLVPDLGGFCRVHEEAYPARKIALICGGLELVLAALLAAAFGAIPLLCTGIVAAGGVGIAVAIDSRNNPAWMVLMAEHRGRVVTLYSTADRLEFGKVRRAVLRAVEANEKPARLPGTDVTIAGDRRGRSATSRSHPGRSDHR
jgi:hypothetical protein